MIRCRYGHKAGPTFTSTGLVRTIRGHTLYRPVKGKSMLFELRDVHYVYMRGTPFASEALRGLSLSIPANQTVALVGPTKAGKSTIVDLLAGLMKPGAGTILFEGADIAAHSCAIKRIRSRAAI